jgi:hypothetical protein
MSTSKDERLAELRRRAFHHLPGSEFDDVLAEASVYHKTHPPGAEWGDLQAMNKTAEKVIAATEHNHALTHREAVMMSFLRKDIPYSLAGEIVDELVLNTEET